MKAVLEVNENELNANFLIIISLINS